MYTFRFPPKVKLAASSLMYVAHLSPRTRYCPQPTCNLGFEYFVIVWNHQVGKRECFTCTPASLALCKSRYASSWFIVVWRNAHIKTQHENTMLFGNYYVAGTLLRVFCLWCHSRVINTFWRNVIWWYHWPNYTVLRVGGLFLLLLLPVPSPWSEKECTQLVFNYQMPALQMWGHTLWEVT